MLNLVLSALFFLLPAYVANMCPVFAGAMRLPLDIPIQPSLFGKHKTYRGVYASYLGALLALFLQRWLQEHGVLESFRLLDYHASNLWLLAALFGLGAIAGDLVKSFFKRRLKIAEGRPWIPFDQIDLVLGALICVSPVYALDLPRVLVLLLLTPFLHFLTNLTGYTLGLKDVWW